MAIMTLVRRLVAFAAGSVLLLPVPAFAEGEGVTPVTLPPAPTLVVPTITVPPLQAPSVGSAPSGELTVPTITVPQLQVPTISVPQLQVPQLQVPSLQVPTISVPQLQVPSLTVPVLQVPDMPAVAAPPPLGVASSTPSSPPNPARGQQGGAASMPALVAPQVTGLISPETLLEMLRVQQAETSVELVAPQEAAATNRLPIGTFAAFGGGIAMISFALSLLRRRSNPSAEA